MRIVLVEHQPANAAETITRFQDENITLDTVAELTNAFALVTRGRYEAVIMDPRFPDGDGLDLVERLRAEGDMTPVLIVSTASDSSARVEWLRRGADACLTKPCAIDELLAQLRALTKRAAVQAQTVLSVEDLSLDLLTQSVTRAGVPIHLLPREFQLLRELMRRAGAVVSRAELWQEIWGYGFDPGTGVVEVHMSRLRRKIDCEPGLPLIHTVRSVGYRVGPLSARLTASSLEMFRDKAAGAKPGRL